LPAFLVNQTILFLIGIYMLCNFYLKLVIFQDHLKA
jgi:hypothetical protein